HRECHRPSRRVEPRRGVAAKTVHAVRAGPQIAGSAGSTGRSETGPRAENIWLHKNLRCGKDTRELIMEKWMQNRKLTTLTRAVVLIALYFVGGLIGKETSFLSGSVALVWPPAGIALAAILLFGYRFWPGVALGAVLFSFMNGMPFGFFTLGTAIGNTMGAIVCAFLLNKSFNFDNALERTRDVAGYIGLACFLGTTVN